MKISYILLQDIGRWTDGWIVYSIYAIVVIAIVAFVYYKWKKGKENKRRNEQLRKASDENKKDFQ